ncbi:S41 family peptidase [Streptomyces griseus]|uniref:S41 family peptidase n=1 Tax=Streptomyces griseus TaxID=1911 RepID=UPI00055B286F|nr:S41 family peptidase [Streptomyces griseus]
MRIAATTATAAAVALTLAAGVAPDASAAGGASASGAATIDGLWRMDGYGTVLDLRRGAYQEYQTTAVSCLKGDSAQRTGPGTYTVDGVVLTVRPGPGPDRATLGADESVSHRALRRIPALPDACTRPMPKDPLTAFDAFWQSFEENYPFFAAKGVDWHAVRDRYRPLVHTGTPRDELYDLFNRMVEPLYDAHVVVQDGDRFKGQVRPGTTAPSEELDTRVKNFVVERDLADATHRQDFASGRITYADLPGGRGYLRLSAFSGYDTTDRSYAAQLAELDRALNSVFTSARVQRLHGLIIDLRVNGGGSDALGIHLAGRLTDMPYVAYAKRARNDPADPTRHTRPEPIRVTPAAHTSRYTGPVAILTGGSTVSAGETFTQALIDRPGRTVRIGQPTQGVFSDVMSRDLPNGMTAWLPNEEFLTRTGRTFDGTGIPPHLTEPVFTEEEFAEHRDSAFDRAVRVLSRLEG